MTLSEQEKKLIVAYRQADERSQYDAMWILESHRKQKMSAGEIISIADFMNKTVDELFSDCH